MRIIYQLKIISLRSFTLYMENSLRFENSLRSKWLNWNSHRSKFPFAWTHVNTNDEEILQLRKILAGNEISDRFEFTSGLM